MRFLRALALRLVVARRFRQVLIAEASGNIPSRLLLRRRGDVPPWVDPDAMSALLVAVANGLVLQVTVDPDGPGLPDMAGQFGALLLAARAPTG